MDSLKPKATQTALVKLSGSLKKKIKRFARGQWWDSNERENGGERVTRMHYMNAYNCQRKTIIIINNNYKVKKGTEI